MNKDIITRDKHHLYGKNWLISSENIIYINNIKSVYLKRVRHQSRHSFVYYLKIYFINKNDRLMFFDETFAYAPISKESEKIKNINDCVNYVYKIYSYFPLEIPVLYESTFKREGIKLEELGEKLDDSLIF